MKKSVFILICILITTFLVSCSGVGKAPDEAKVLNDFNAAVPELSFANLDSAEFIRQQVNKADKKFIADVMLTGKDEYANYSFNASLTYNYYDDRGWMLDAQDYASAGIRCYRGRDFKEVKKEIEDNCLSYFPGCSYIEVLNMESDLNSNREIVTLNYEILNKHVVAYYEEAKMCFVYTGGRWQLTEINSQSDNYYINLKGTKWVAENSDMSFFILGENKFDIEITEIADDSTAIKFLYNGIERTATIHSSSNDEESFMKLGSVNYKLGKPIEWIGLNNSKRTFETLSLTNLTGDGEVSLVLRGPNSVYFNLEGDAPEYWSYEDEIN